MNQAIDLNTESVRVLFIRKATTTAEARNLSVPGLAGMTLAEAVAAINNLVPWQNSDPCLLFWDGVSDQALTARFAPECSMRLLNSPSYQFLVLTESKSDEIKEN